MVFPSVRRRRKNASRLTLYRLLEIQSKAVGLRDSLPFSSLTRDFYDGVVQRVRRIEGAASPSDDDTR